MSAPFDFLDPLAKLQDKIDELRQMADQTGVDYGREIGSLDEKLATEGADRESSELRRHRAEVAHLPRAGQRRGQTSGEVHHLKGPLPARLTRRGGVLTQ